MNKRPDLPLPANVDAERAILGAILFDSSYYRKVVGKLDAADFSLDSHRIIFNAMQELDEAGSAIDIVTLVEQLKVTKVLDRIGETPVAYIASLTEGLPWRPSIRDYLRIVREKRILRSIISLCSSVSSSAWEQQTTSSEILDRLQSGMEGLTGGKCDITPRNAELGGVTVGSS